MADDPKTDASPSAKLDKAIEDFAKIGTQDAQAVVASLEAIRKHEQEQGWKDPNPKDLIENAAKRVLAFGAIAEAKIEHGNAQQQADGRKELDAVEGFIKDSLIKDSFTKKQGAEVLASKELSMLKADASAILGDKIPEGGVEALVKKFEGPSLRDFVTAAEQGIPAPRVDPMGSEERNKIGDALFPVEQALRNTIDPEKSLGERLKDIQNFKLDTPPPAGNTLDAAIKEFIQMGGDQEHHLAGDLAKVKAVTMQPVPEQIKTKYMQDARDDLSAYADKAVQDLKDGKPEGQKEIQALEALMDPKAKAIEEGLLQKKDFGAALDEIKKSLKEVIDMNPAGGHAQLGDPATQSLPKVAMATVKSSQLG